MVITVEQSNNATFHRNENIELEDFIQRLAADSNSAVRHLRRTIAKRE